MEKNNGKAVAMSCVQKTQAKRSSVQKRAILVHEAYCQLVCSKSSANLQERNTRGEQNNKLDFCT